MGASDMLRQAYMNISTTELHPNLQATAVAALKIRGDHQAHCGQCLGSWISVSPRDLTNISHKNEYINSQTQANSHVFLVKDSIKHTNVISRTCWEKNCLEIRRIWKQFSFRTVVLSFPMLWLLTQFMLCWPPPNHKIIFSHNVNICVFSLFEATPCGSVSQSPEGHYLDAVNTALDRPKTMSVTKLRNSTVEIIFTNNLW